MAIAFGSAGAAVGGTTTLAPACPAVVASGNILLLCIGGKYPANLPSTPAGWNLLTSYSGGAGASGVDIGQAYAIVFYRVADGTEGSTTINVTVTSGNTCKAQILRYTKSASFEWGIAATGGSQNTGGTAWAVTGDADPNLNSGDMMIAFSGVNSDVASFSLESATALGVTFGTMTERIDTSTTNGDDCAMFASEHPVTTGPSSAAIVYAATGSATSTNAPAGATMFVRLFELDGSGTLAITEASDTVVATGTNTDNGALAKTEASDTVVATGTNTDNGAASITEASDTVVSTGTNTDNGVASITEASDTTVATGTVTGVGVGVEPDGATQPRLPRFHRFLWFLGIVMRPRTTMVARMRDLPVGLRARMRELSLGPIKWGAWSWTFHDGSCWRRLPSTVAIKHSSSAWAGQRSQWRWTRCR